MIYFQFLRNVDKNFKMSPLRLYPILLDSPRALSINGVPDSAMLKFKTDLNFEQILNEYNSKN